MGKKAGYIDPDDERLKVGQKQLVEDSAKWKGPSHKERQQEREIKTLGLSGFGECFYICFHLCS